MTDCPFDLSTVAKVFRTGSKVGIVPVDVVVSVIVFAEIVTKLTISENVSTLIEASDKRSMLHYKVVNVFPY